MNTMGTIIAIALVVSAAACAIGGCILGWISRGEPDVNGDPERDAGIDDAHIERMCRYWDQGSHRTAVTADLETARQLNRLRMHQAAAEWNTIDTQIPTIHHHG